MLVREFKLVNEKGQEYSLMDLENHCFLSDPSGLGYGYTTEYQQLGNTFVTNLRNFTQGQISGIANFKSYDNYKALIDFIESSENLRFSYKIPFKTGTREYFKDVQISDISKTQKKTNGILSETVNFDCLSLWYEENTVTYTVEPLSNEIRWDFRWDSRFSDYDSRNLSYINEGHVEAPIYVEMDGHLVNPKIILSVDGEVYQTVEITTEIQQYEKLIYDSRENKFTVAREKADGTIEDLFSLDCLDIAKDNVVRLPKNRSCQITLTADNEVLNAQLTIYPRYKAV